MVCSKVLRLQGAAYPSGCPEHGLGPCPEVPALPTLASINDVNAVWPKRQDPRQVMNGDVVYLPRTGILGTVVHVRPAGAGVAPLLAPPDSLYPPGGYDIYVNHDELSRCVIIGDDMLRLVEQYALRKLRVS